MQVDYSGLEKTEAAPEATSMIETFRAIGYSLESAISDIIDNSISAGAENIWIDYQWNGPDTILSVIDNGCGMNNEELIQAMRPGSRHPMAERDASDLGRFGLGLKTASFSQCRKFCVLSKKQNYHSVHWAWDLDFVNESKSWSLIRYCPDASCLSDKIDQLKNGTAVIWWDLDRLTKDTSRDSEESKSKFFEAIEKVKKHLGMVFHRFIEEGLCIYLRDRKIESWDPFMIGIEGLQPRPETTLASGRIRIKGFVLPHRSRLNPEQYEYGKGPKESWTAHQGFYIYRNKRLLVAGDWLGLFKREAHFDLCRVKIDLTNDLDSEWQIDIKKSQAKPPAILRDQIISIAREVRVQGVEAYRHRGKVIKRKISPNEFKPMWQEKKRFGKRYYEINRDHPLIIALSGESQIERKYIEKLLSYIEETVPVPLITLNENINETQISRPFEGRNTNQLKEDMKKLYNNFIEKGNSHEQAKKVLYFIEPYDNFPEIIESINEL